MSAHLLVPPDSADMEKLTFPFSATKELLYTKTDFLGKMKSFSSSY